MRATKAYLQQQLRERDARAKLRQKEYADKTRAAKYSDIKAGYKVLFKQSQDNKLSPNYKPDPYVITHRDANTVVLQDANGNNKMRNIAHMKKFVESVTIEMEESDKQEHPVQTAKPEHGSQPASTAIQPSAQTQEALPETSQDNSETSRPVRVRHASAWMKDYVCS